VAKQTAPEQIVALAQSLKKSVPEQAALLQEALNWLKNDAIQALLTQRQQIDEALLELGHTAPEPGKRRGRRGPMSPETREKMRKAWERRKAAAGE